MDETENYYKLGLTGWPLEQSLSPLIHSEFLKCCKLHGEYELYPLMPELFVNDVSILLETGITGLNVTYPHKAAAYRICDKIKGDAAVIGAINTIHRIEGVNYGYNTDTCGFRHLLSLLSPPEPFFIVGAGGVALAVDSVLSSDGAESVVFSRNQEAWRGNSPARKLDEIESAILSTEDCTVINATTLGWMDDDSFPVDAESLKDRFFIDLNYNRSWKWRNLLHTQSSRVFTGESMLVYQAAESFRIWTGIMPETEDVLLMIQHKLEKDDVNGAY
ncbi:MAG: hypothetical protein KAW14_03335 [Candidatus Aegiribacteria sp.]|nr:hypothetical protein [Candidatus Aegiribacteria sp.]